MEESEPRYVVFRNDAGEQEYEQLKEKLYSKGIDYEEIDDDGPFASKPLSSPVLGVNTSIGYIPHDGWDKIKEALDTLEGESIDGPEKAEG